MKKYVLFSFLVLALMACTNGKTEKGTLVENDSLVRDSVSTLTEAELSGVVDSLRSVSFLQYFDATLSDDGAIKAQFHHIEDDEFTSLFSSENCPTEMFEVETLEGRCTGIKVMTEGSGVDPVLFMIMDDGHVERVSLYELSQGKLKSVFRSSQTGIVDFAEKTTDGCDGTLIVGVKVDGSRVELDWKTDSVAVQAAPTEQAAPAQ